MTKISKAFYQFFNTFWGGFTKVFVPALVAQILIAQEKGIDIFTWDSHMAWRIGITTVLSLLAPVANAANPMDNRYGKKAKPSDFPKEADKITS